MLCACLIMTSLSVTLQLQQPAHKIFMMMSHSPHWREPCSVKASLSMLRVQAAKQTPVCMHNARVLWPCMHIGPVVCVCVLVRVSKESGVSCMMLKACNTESNKSLFVATLYKRSVPNTSASGVQKLRSWTRFDLQPWVKCLQATLPSPNETQNAVINNIL